MQEKTKHGKLEKATDKNSITEVEGVKGEVYYYYPNSDDAEKQMVFLADRNDPNYGRVLANPSLHVISGTFNSGNAGNDVHYLRCSGAATNCFDTVIWGSHIIFF